MTVSFTSNASNVNRDVNIAAALAVRNMLESVRTESEPITPKRIGDLRKNIIISMNNTTGSITWHQDYSLYVEKKRFKNYTTPGTGPHFAERSVNAVVNNSDVFFNNALRYMHISPEIKL